MRDWGWFILGAVAGLLLVTTALHYLITNYISLNEPWFIAFAICAYSMVVAVLASMREAKEELDD